MDIRDVIKGLEAERAALITKIEIYDNALNLLKTSIVTSDQEPASSMIIRSRVNDYTGYSDLKNLRHKILRIIKTEGRFVHVREIAEKAHEFEPTISLSDFNKKISQTLSNLKGSGSYNLTNLTVGKASINTFWGLKTWLDDDGNVRPEYVYDDGQISQGTMNELVGL